MKKITITLSETGETDVNFHFTQEEQLKVITPLEFKKMRRVLEIAYSQQKRNHRLEQYNVPSQS